MKIFTTILFLAALAASLAASQEKSADSPDRKMLNGFGGHLLVVENPRAFIEEWKKPVTPNIKPAREVKHGALLGVFVLFAGCKPDPQGNCKSEVDYTIYEPDGTVFVERKSQPLWDAPPVPAPNVQLGKAILAFTLLPDATDGEYKVKAKVSDLNANITLELETKFRLH